MTQIALANSISDVPSGEWDELEGGSVLASHACLRLIEETSPAGPACRYVLARDGSRLQAAMTWWMEKRDGPVAVIENLLFGRLRSLPRALGVRTLPSMNCGGLLCWHAGVFFRLGLSESERARLFEALLARAEEEAERAGFVMCLRNMAATEKGLSEVLFSRGYLQSPELPVCYLDVEWDSFDGYLKWLKARHPRTAKNIRAELRNGGNAGVVISHRPDPGPEAAQLHRLMDVHSRRLNHKPFSYRPEFFQRLKPYLKDRCVVYTATLQGRVVAAQVMFCDEDSGFIPMIGIDDAEVRHHDLYFNLAFNRPIEEAARVGLKRLCFGRMVYGTKIRRGCRLAAANLFIRATGRLDRVALRCLLAARARRINSMMTGMGCRD